MQRQPDGSMQRQPKNSLNEAIRAAVVEALMSGETTSRDVLDTVIERHDDLIQEHGYNLALRGVRTSYAPQ